MNSSRFSAVSASTGSAERKSSLQMRRFQTISEFSHSLDPKRSLPDFVPSACCSRDRGAPANHVDKRFGERDRLIRFRDAQVRSSKVAKNGYVRRIRFERPPYGGVDDQRPTMLSLAKLLGVPSGRRTVSSA